MCRPNVQGGRRCPSDTDPIKRAERNAKKRAAYAAKKVDATRTTKASTSPDEVEVSPSSTSALQGPQKGSEGQQGHVQTRQDHDTDSSPNVIGVRAVKNENFNPDLPIFQPSIIKGRIDFEKLHEGSYKEFGFEAVTPEGEDWVHGEDNSQHYNPNRYRETDSLTPRQVRAVEEYTSAGSAWLNRSIYNPHDIFTDAPALPFMLSGAIDTNPDVGSILEGSQPILPGVYNVELLQQVTNELDEALTKGPKKQRVVYRGVTGERLGATGDISKWVTEHRSVGTVVTFDGYTSTTAHRTTAHDFSVDATKGAVYEILTPEGMEVESLTKARGEKEIILPRNQRYVVVGTHRDGEGLNIIQMVAVNSKDEVLDGTNSDPMEPFVSDETRKRVKENFHLSVWKRALLIESGTAFGPKSPLGTMEPERLRALYQRSANQAIKQLTSSGLSKDADNLKKLLEVNPGIGPDEAIRQLH